jgi:hypothetical protein
MRKRILIPSLLMFILSSALVIYCQTQLSQGTERIASGYAKIFCDNDETLRLFNKRVKLGSLSSLLRGRGSRELSLEGQVAEKVDVIVERVKMILEMHPKNFRVSIHVLPDAESVRAAYRKKYYRDVEFLAFYAPAERAIYIAADEVKSHILGHELAHAVIDQFFGVAAPVKIHEILAEYVDENFEE